MDTILLLAGSAVLVGAGFFMNKWGDASAEKAEQRRLMKEYRDLGRRRPPDLEPSDTQWGDSWRPPTDEPRPQPPLAPPALVHPEPADDFEVLHPLEAEKLIEALGADDFPGLPMRIRLKTISVEVRDKWAAMLKIDNNQALR